MVWSIKRKYIMLLVVGLALIGWVVPSQSSDKDISSKTQIDTTNVYDAANGSKLNGASLKAPGTPQVLPTAKAPSYLLPVKSEPKPSSMVITNPYYTPTVKSEPKLPAVITTRPGAPSTPISKGATKKGGVLTPPSNDDCTGAPLINTFPQTIYGTTIDATADCPDDAAPRS